MAAKKDKPRPLNMADRGEIMDEIGAEPVDPDEPNGVMTADIEKIREAGAIDPESIQANRRNQDVVNRKKGNEKSSFDDPNIVLKYEDTLKIWPVNSLSIYVNRLTGTQVQHQILSQPRNGVELYNEIKAFHGRREESLYEVMFRDSTHGEYRGKGRITMPNTLNEPAPQMQGQNMGQPPPFNPYGQPGYVPQQPPVTQPPIVQVVPAPSAPQQPGTDLVAMMKQMLEMYRLMQPQQQQMPPPPMQPVVLPQAPVVQSQDPNVAAMTQMMEMMRTMLPPQPGVQQQQPMPPVILAPPPPVAPAQDANASMMMAMTMMKQMFEMARSMQPPPPPPLAEPMYREPRGPAYGPRPYGGGPAYGPRPPEERGYGPQAYGPGPGGPPQGRQKSAAEEFREAISVVPSVTEMVGEFQQPRDQQQYAPEPEEDDSPVKVMEVGPARMVINRDDGTTRLWESAFANSPAIFKWVGDQFEKVQKNALALNQQQQQQQQRQQQQLTPGTVVEMTPGYVPPEGWVAIPVDQMPPQQHYVQQNHQQHPQQPQYAPQPQQQYAPPIQGGGLPPPPTNLPPTIDAIQQTPPQQQPQQQQAEDQNFGWGAPLMPEDQS